ncbi:hypothetical protein PSU4_51270 [Pseudonocardia sulfidoxydans NBRC 16205]|uniref:Nitroreductase n=1 Tax=Pseudonocardia sulfidoxydans NBRC 16205 TaxID=1223511 RepID=A0A511DPJ4_9PSEU|nr:nitroreductase family deazaflavin-dependent oxidoreductase [Pseudonocardia sulfidoxydans]GEL26173.1 hypothetical protein PSU4_51270 [Pseudonocardia sulfidoxydans NBRC 16205]
MPEPPRNLSRAVASAGERILRSRPLVRAPILVYHAGLGRLFGSRLLLLEHTGRRTGLAREVVLEVVDRPGPGRYVVVSGFDARAQWLRNVTVQPQVRVSVGRRTSAPATARVLPTEEAGRVLTGYANGRRGWWTWFRPVVERTLGRPVDAASPPPTVELVLTL